jgi:hypothetical protein
MLVTDCGEDHMSDDAAARGTDAEWLGRLVAARGLGRAYALFPETVTASFTRASQCMTTLPKGFPPLTEPATRFDPTAVTGAE